MQRLLYLAGQLSVLESRLGELARFLALLQTLLDVLIQLVPFQPSNIAVNIRLLVAKPSFVKVFHGVKRSFLFNVVHSLGNENLEVQFAQRAQIAVKFQV
jgi:hypothetical protein